MKWFKKSDKQPKTPPTVMTPERAEAVKRFYALREDRELKALYKNRYGVELIIKKAERKKE